MFSVVVCNYNAGRFLAQALDSVLAQTEPPIEILIADDGSSDDSAGRARAYRDKVRWISIPHAGQAAALNAVLPLCRGDWVAFLESDDLWSSDKLALLAAALRAHPEAAALQHGMLQADEALRPLPTHLPPGEALWTLDDFLAGRALLTGLSALAARAEALKRLLPLPADLATCVDEYLQPRLLAPGPVLHLGRALGLRRVHGGNFYAGAASDPARLRTYLTLRGALDAHLASFLEERGASLAPEHARLKSRLRAEWDLLLSVLEGRRSRAWRPYARAVRLCGPKPYAAFKAATLLLALLSPRAYGSLRGLYERLRLGAARRLP